MDTPAPSGELRIEYQPLSGITPAVENPKLHHLGEIHLSMDRFGFTAPILVNETTGRLVAGHGRVDTLKQRQASGAPPPANIRESNGEWFVPVIRGLSFESDSDARAYVLADNRLTELGGWDDVGLAEILKGLAEEDGGLIGTGFDGDDLDEILQRINQGGGGSDGAASALSAEQARATLAERFLVPPFSVLDARQGYWQERKRAWLALGIESELGRGSGTWVESEQTGSPADPQANYSKKASPGGSPRPAMKLNQNGKTDRGDGKGRKI